MYLCIVEGHNAALPEIAMIGVAAFTFYNAATAAITATRTRRGNLRQQTMLRVSVAGTIGAMLMLEMQMFGTYARLDIVISALGMFFVESIAQSELRVTFAVQ